jgi:NAD(P)-dependent dehydrogenase (short-subunit alcohol dehydrogenase family)
MTEIEEPAHQPSTVERGLMRFGNKVAIVTGAGSGIGAATAQLLAAEGAAVLVADVTDEAGRGVVDSITAAGGSAAYQHVDISQPTDVAAMIDAAVSTFGGLHAAVNNAGLSGAESRTHEITVEDWDRIINVNLRGTFLCLQAEVTHFLAHGGGSIVNIASGAGLKAGPPGLSAYTASKHGVVGLTRNAAIDYIKDNIRINAVAPGTTATALIKAYPAETQQRFAEMMPCGRMAEPAEIAEAIAWILSDQASYVSGTVLEADMAFLQK